MSAVATAPSLGAFARRTAVDTPFDRVRHAVAALFGQRRTGARSAGWAMGVEAAAGGETHDGGASALVDALRAGDEAAFLGLVKRYHAAMVRVALAYVPSRSVAEEVAQEAWIGVLHGIRLFEGRSSLKTWIFRIVVNCAKARGLREARSLPLSALATDGDEGPSVPEDRFRDSGVWTGHWARPPVEWTDDRLGSAQLAALVKEGIERLPPSQRQVMTLRDVDGWESAEVCEVMGLSEGNQRVLLHRARSKVRAYVEERLGKEVRS